MFSFQPQRQCCVPEEPRQEQPIQLWPRASQGTGGDLATRKRSLRRFPSPNLEHDLPDVERSHH